MKRLVIAIAALLAATPASAQQSGRITFVLTQGGPTGMQYMESVDLAVQVRQMLNNRMVVGTAMPLVLDGEKHERRVTTGGDPSVFIGSNLSRTVVKGLQRDILISYGPARSGGIGVHAEMVDSTITPELDGRVRKASGPIYQVTGIVPDDGRPQAVMAQVPSGGISTTLPQTLIILVEP